MNKRLVIIDRLRNRCPLIHDLHKELTQGNGLLIESDNDQELLTGLETGLQDQPDVLMVGMGLVNLLKTDEFIKIARRYKNSGTKLMIEVGDLEWFPFEHLADLPAIDYTYMPVQPGWGFREDFVEVLKQFAATKDTKAIFIPFGIDPAKYELNLERNIDLSFICTASPTHIFHQQRIVFKNAVERYRGNQGRNLNIFIGNVYGAEYIQTLNRTKILIVDTSLRGGLSQKYLEGAMSGCLLMGDRPRECDGIFESGVSFVKLSGNLCQQQLPDKVQYYLDHDEERSRIAVELKKRLIESNRIDRIVNRFFNELNS